MTTSSKELNDRVVERVKSLTSLDCGTFSEEVDAIMAICAEEYARGKREGKSEAYQDTGRVFISQEATRDCLKDKTQ